MARRSQNAGVLVVASVALALAACGDPPTPPVEEAPTFTLSGVITERSTEGARPSAGAHVSLYFWKNFDRVTLLNNNILTDAQGRYAFPGLPAGVGVLIRVGKGGYVQQCASPRLTVESNLSRDEQLVAANVVTSSASSVPAPAPGYRFVSGTVYGPNRQPVAGARVIYSVTTDAVFATTVTDGGGRYLLCGLPEPITVSIEAEWGSYSSSTLIPPGGSTDRADIVLGL